MFSNTALIVCVVSGVFYVLCNLDIRRDPEHPKRSWEPWTELFRIGFFAGLLAYLLGK